MKLLLIGGSGLISSACAELAIRSGHDLTLLNRSISRKCTVPGGARLITADVHTEGERVATYLKGPHFDAVVDFVAFTTEDIERDIWLFRGKTLQFVFVSSASVYEKPSQSYLVTEDTTLDNPYWQYARDKIACKERLLGTFQAQGFPATIVRPSFTYEPTQIPFCVGSWAHPWTVVQRMLNGKKVIVPGDGTSLWILTWNGDLAKGLVGLLGRADAIGEAFQITSDEVLTWDQIYLQAYVALEVVPNILHVPADLIAEYWPHAHGSLLGDKVRNLVFDNSKIKRFVPEFRCDITWSAGVKRAIEWHWAHPEFRTVDRKLDEVMDDIVTGMDRARPWGIPRDNGAPTPRI